MAYTKEQKAAHRLTCEKPDCWCRRKRSGKSGGRLPDGRRKRQELPFIALDGEALGHSGYHLLAASTGDQIEDRETGLTSEQCLRWLLSLKWRNGKAIYCGFGLGYDFEHWVRDYGPEVWEQLRQEGMQAEVKIGHQNYTIACFHRKFFKIGQLKNGKAVWYITVYDLFGFFQCSFLKALKDWGVGTAEELAVIAAGKEQRGGFAVENWEEIVAYNALECRLLVELAGRLRRALDVSDMVPSRWHGPGAVADRLLKKHGVKDHIADISQLQDAFRRSYFGGRFQVFKVGHLKGVYNYDLSSAYPWGTTLLPSTQGEWVPVSSLQSSPWGVYRVEWDLPVNSSPFLGPFPWRDRQGCIHYPPYGHGWYWGPEVAAALALYPDRLHIREGWLLHPVEERIMAEWMLELAERRVEAKHAAAQATGERHYELKAIERAYKLGLNSVYGKTIQTVGNHPYLCPMWAGLITAFTRARMLENAAKAQSVTELVAFATDGLFTSAPLPVGPVGKGLGEWDTDGIPRDLRIYQSGCYAAFDADGTLRAETAKFRGLNARSEVDWSRLAAEWEQSRCSGQVTFQASRFIGYKLALAHKRPEHQATWQTIEKKIDLCPGVGMACVPGHGAPATDEDCQYWLTWDPQTDYSELSYPHRKLPAGETEEEQWLDECTE